MLNERCAKFYTVNHLGLPRESKKDLSEIDALRDGRVTIVWCYFFQNE
jgi:hypothetical protein